MYASIDKALAALVAAGLTAAGSLLLTGTADYAELLAVATGLVTMGAVFLVKYSERLPYKAATALVIPVVVGFLSAVQTGNVNDPEFVLAVEALLGAILAYVAKRVEQTRPPRS